MDTILTYLVILAIAIVVGNLLFLSFARLAGLH